MRYSVAAILCYLVLLVSSCSAPNELDTPRKTMYGSEAQGKITARSVEISFTGDPTATPTAYTGSWQQAEVDTMGGLRLWLRGEFTRPALSDSTRFPAKQLTLAFDSVDISTDSVRIIGTEGTAAGTSLVCYSLSAERDKELVPDNGFTKFVMKNIRHDKPNRTITAELNFNVAPDGRELEFSGALILLYR